MELIDKSLFININQRNAFPAAPKDKLEELGRTLDDMEFGDVLSIGRWELNYGMIYKHFRERVTIRFVHAESGRQSSNYFKEYDTIYVRKRK